MVKYLLSLLRRKIPTYYKCVMLKILYKIRFLCNSEFSLRYQQEFEKQQKKGIRNIPIFLVSFNRLSYLEQMIKCIEKKGYSNIIIIDNASSYPPLLEYYKTIPYKVIYLNKNWGHMVMWKAPELAPYRQEFYVLSDPDLEIIDECPSDFMEYFFNCLKRNPYTNKVGFSLRIDDLPKDGIFGDEVYKTEQKFNQKQIEKGIFAASIDTTFALYVPDSLYKENQFYLGLRTAHPYTVRHLPWYKKAGEVTEEDIYYSTHKTTGQWDVTHIDKTTNI